MDRRGTLHAVYHEPALRRHAVSESRALKRQRETLEAKKAELEKSLAAVKDSIKEVDSKKRRTRSHSLLTFEDSKNVVYTVPMDAENVKSRLMTDEAKRAIIANMRAAVRERDSPPAPPVTAPQPQPSPQEEEHESALESKDSNVVTGSENPDATVQPSSWLDCGGLGWFVGSSEGADAQAQGAKPALATRSPLKRVQLLSNKGPRGISKTGFRVKVPGSVRPSRG